jgi:hypothetical protein
VANDEKPDGQSQSSGPKKDELQQELKDAGSSTSGTKAELLERVKQLDKVHRPDTYAVQIKPDGTFKRVSE